MTSIEDLPTPSITSMSPDEAIEHLRQLRLRRRMPAKRKSSNVKKKQKQEKAVGNLTSDQALELLKRLQK